MIIDVCKGLISKQSAGYLQLRNLTMKKLLIIILALAAQLTNAQTTFYHKFPDSAAIWNYHFYGCIYFGNTVIENYSIILTGDTIINNLNYNKLNINFIQANYPNSCGATIGYKGAIRQDTLAKKVYIVPPAQTSEQLFYDFTLQVGDTVKGYIAKHSDWYTELVISIDSVLIGNSFRKRWNIDTCYNISIIEGIGSTYGLIESGTPCNTDVYQYSLNCFSQNGSSLYPTTTSSCELITSFGSADKNSNKILIFPNPSTGSFTIDLDPLLNFRAVLLTDLLGNILMQQKVDIQTSIKIDDLRNGTYILSFVDKYDRIISRKIISSL